MATAVWTGTLSFGLVTLPCGCIPRRSPRTCASTSTTAKAVGSATSEWWRPGRNLRRIGSSYRRPTPPGTRTPAPRARPPRPPGAVETPVAWDDVVRGVETDAGELVTVPREELERIRPERSRSIDIQDFVDLEQIDPVYLDKAITRSR